MDKELNKAMESVFTALGKGIIKGFKGVFFGITKLGEKKRLIAFLVCGAVTVIGMLLRRIIFSIPAPFYIHYMIYLPILCAPFIYLYAIGSKTEEKEKDKYEKMFQDIGFKGKDGKCPFFLGAKEVDKKVIYTFSSNISLDEWKQNKSKLETALNVTILAFEQPNSKKIVKLVTVPADFKIPSMIVWKDELISTEDGVVKIGESALDVIEFNLNKTPHALYAGETGSGKSVLLRTCLWQMISKDAIVFMIDFKGGVEFGLDYEKYGEVVTDRKRALEVLDMLCKENDKRLKLFRNMKAKNLAEFNKKTGKNLCRIGLFCDEIAEMLDKTGASKEEKQLYCEIEARLATLARLSRATGINLFLGVQRPDARILPGQIKNNIPVRVSGRFADKTASEIVLGTTDAVNLPPVKGRFLYKVGNQVIQFQSYYFDDDTMLHDVHVKQGGTLTNLKMKESKPVDIDKIKIYGGDDTEETVEIKPAIVVKKKESEENVSEDADMNFDYSDILDSGPEPDYSDEDEE